MAAGVGYGSSRPATRKKVSGKTASPSKSLETVRPKAVAGVGLTR